MREYSCFLSVVVPVYNTEKYLKRCLDSALAASIDNMQIILVDDGSTDGSPVICDQYAAEHTNVSVIHQKNSGVSVLIFSAICTVLYSFLYWGISRIMGSGHHIWYMAKMLPQLVIYNGIVIFGQ